MYSSVLISFLITTWQVNIATSVCSYGSSCVNTTITSGNNVQCLDYKSCIHSTLLLWAGFQCEGALSCVDTKVEIFTNKSKFESNDVKQLTLNGFLSLSSSIAHLHNSTSNNIQSMSELSLHNSQIYDITGYLYCYGFRSCDSIILNGSPTIIGYGTLSLYNSIIKSNGNSTLEIQLYGLYAGYNTTIYCQSGHNCSLMCYGNGCEGNYFVYICFSYTNVDKMHEVL